MADLSITAASVGLGGSNVTFERVAVSVTVTQGIVAYLNGSSYAKAHCETSVVTAKAAGIILTPVTTSGYAIMATRGPIIIGATLVPWTLYVLSVNGLICPSTDLATNDWVTTLGIAISTTVLDLKIDATGYQK